MRGWPGAERAKWGREESLYWIDEQIRSIELKALQIGAHRCRIPLRFRQPLLTTLQQLRKAVEGETR